MCHSNSGVQTHSLLVHNNCSIGNMYDIVLPRHLNQLSDIADVINICDICGSGLGLDCLDVGLGRVACLSTTRTCWSVTVVSHCTSGLGVG